MQLHRRPIILSLAAVCCLIINGLIASAAFAHMEVAREAVISPAWRRLAMLMAFPSAHINFDFLPFDSFPLAVLVNCFFWMLVEGVAAIVFFRIARQIVRVVRRS